jgi:heme/copper-type cytochrome/quinol oxidase subunit 3
MAQGSQPLAAPEHVRAEDESFYHESGLNATWTGVRLAIGGLTFLYAAFAFAFFYLRSVNSAGRWAPTSNPQLWAGTVIMLLSVCSAAVHYFGLQRIKTGNKRLWFTLGWVAFALGLAAVIMQIVQLLKLPFPPGSSGYASVFTGFYPVFLVSQLSAAIWLEILLMRARSIPAISFIEQPPTRVEVYSVQRFQASLSAFSTMWTYLGVISVLFYLLFYAF